jgi:hypothetical protein
MTASRPPTIYSTFQPINQYFQNNAKQSITHIGCEGELLDSDGLDEGKAEGVGEVEPHPEQVPEIVQPGHAVHLHKDNVRDVTRADK